MVTELSTPHPALARVRREAALSVLRVMPLTLGGNLVMGGVIFVVTRPVAPHWVTTLWFVLMLAQLVLPLAWMLQGALRRRRIGAAQLVGDATDGQTHGPGRHGALHWGWVGALLSGLMWGCGAALLFMHVGYMEQMLILFVVAGMGMGGIYAMGYLWRTYAAFVVPSVLPLMWVNLSNTGPVNDAVGLMCGLFLLTVLTGAWMFARTIETSLALRHENTELIAALQRERDVANKANEAKSHFVASASHDLRQPLSALSLNLFSLTRTPLSAEAQAFVAQSRTAADSLNNMLTALLDVARLETGHVQARLEWLPLQPLIARLATDIALIARHKGLDFRVKCPDCAVLADPVMLERIIRNLADNAMRYTVRGGLLLAVRRRTGQVLIQMWDTGLGIELADRERVFGAYTRASAGIATHEMGVGLGLAIVRQLSLAMGATSAVSSVVGRGSVFSIGLSADFGGGVFHARSKSAHAEFTVSDFEGAGDANRWVALIDDNADSLGAMRIVLEQAGFAVRAASDSRQILAAVATQARPPLAIVSDQRLVGDMTGLELIAALRDEFNDDGIAALLVTGEIDPQLLPRCQDADVMLLRKPIDGAQLIAFCKQAARVQSVA